MPATPEGRVRAAGRAFVTSGTGAVSAGLVVAAVTSYGFFAIGARAIGVDAYAALSTLYVITLIIGPGVFFPIEQEVTRAVSVRRVARVSGGPMVRRAALVSAVSVGVLLLATGAGAVPLVDHLFGGDPLLLVGLLVALVAYGAQFLVRGICAGTHAFAAYGVILAVDGGARLVLCAAFALIGVTRVGWYGLILGIAPMVAVVPVARRFRMMNEPGPPAAWSELTRALGSLMVGQLLAQLLLNAGPIIVTVLADESQKKQASRLLAALVIARIPLYLFQAVQATLLPRLTAMVAQDRRRHMVGAVLKVCAGLAVVGAMAAVVSAAVGPWSIGLVFGADFRLGRADVGLLAAAVVAYILALVLTQALIAQSFQVGVLLGWAAGVATLGVVTVVQHSLLPKVEEGFLIGSIVTAGTMLALLLRSTRRVDPTWADAMPEPATP
jgi:O-antigen/teichoic acid export membrane protein